MTFDACSRFVVPWSFPEAHEETRALDRLFAHQQDAV